MDIQNIKLFIYALITFIILDYIFLGYIMNSFYTKELSPLAKLIEGKLQINIYAAFVTYLLLTLGMIIFVLPNITNLKTGFIYGALFGFIVYGVYDLTNYAIVTNWSLKLLIIDWLWGTLLNGLVGIIISKLI